MMVRWPGTVAPGQKSDDIISQEDWLPTLLAAAGEPDIVGKLQKATAPTVSVSRPPGWLQLQPFLEGKVDEGPQVLYFDAEGNPTQSAGVTGRSTSPYRKAISPMRYVRHPAGRW